MSARKILFATMGFLFGAVLGMLIDHMIVIRYVDETKYHPFEAIGIRVETDPELVIALIIILLTGMMGISLASYLNRHFLDRKSYLVSMKAMEQMESSHPAIRGHLSKLTRERIETITNEMVSGTKTDFDGYLRILRAATRKVRRSYIGIVYGIPVTKFWIDYGRLFLVEPKQFSGKRVLALFGRYKRVLVLSESELCADYAVPGNCVLDFIKWHEDRNIRLFWCAPYQFRIWHDQHFTDIKIDDFGLCDERWAVMMTDREGTGYSGKVSFVDSRHHERAVSALRAFAKQITDTARSSAVKRLTVKSFKDEFCKSAAQPKQC